MSKIETEKKVTYPLRTGLQLKTSLKVYSPSGYDAVFTIFFKGDASVAKPKISPNFARIYLNSYF